jgi:hypothetical protein
MRGNRFFAGGGAAFVLLEQETEQLLELEDSEKHKSAAFCEI